MQPEPLPMLQSPEKPAGDNRILAISRVGCPPPNGGSRARMAALLLEMRRLGYEVHFAGVCMTEEEKASTRPMVDQWVGDFAWPAMPSNWQNPWPAIQGEIYRLLHRLRLVKDRVDGPFCDRWLEEARELQRRFQYPRVFVAYVFHSKFFQAFPDSCLKILDTHDSFSRPLQQLRTPADDLARRSYSPRDEKRGLLRAHRVIAIQDQEAAYFRQLLGSACEVRTVGHIAEVLGQPPAPAPRLGCVGSRHPFNLQGWQWFFREIWFRVRQRLPEAELWVAGGICDECESEPGLRILGQIPRLEDFYRDCSVLVNPVQNGTGLKIKTIEALLHGRPIVTTSVGAEGLDSFRGHGLMVCDSGEEFAGAVVRLLSDLSQARQLGEAALRQARSYCLENRRIFAEVLAK